LQNFLDGLADAQWCDALQIGMPLEKNDALDQSIGVMHFLDGFCAFPIGQFCVAPVVQQTIMDPILIDRAKFEKEGFVTPLDDMCFASHEVLRSVAASACHARSAGSRVRSAPEQAGTASLPWRVR